MGTEDLNESTRGPADVLRLLERAVAVARRRRRCRLGLAFVGLALLGAFVALAVLLLAGA